MQIYNAKKISIKCNPPHEQPFWARAWIIASCSVGPLQVLIASNCKRIKYFDY